MGKAKSGKTGSMMTNSINLVKKLGAKKGKSKNIFGGLSFDLTKNNSKNKQRRGGGWYEL